MKRFGNGHSDSASNAASDDAYLLKSVKVCCHTERSYEILQIVTCLFVRKLFGGRSDYLIDNLDRSLLLIHSCDGQRNTLSVLIHTQYDKLTRTRFACNQRRFYMKFNHRWVQLFFVYYFVHCYLL